jgi:hypothetical protein
MSHRFHIKNDKYFVRISPTDFFVEYSHIFLINKCHRMLIIIYKTKNYLYNIVNDNKRIVL